ncbi:DinB family protein [Gimesia aquarii]|uniref:DinB superfamily protein n=1 Tax=Gimesia aquarii TaxID=2527964 RepID=A0A517X1D9_9PLAN|nr:DinB family protein [Gimesia aquarii]QDU11325.1 DinB superfamily protein [Gimesia aquarii]
MSDYIATIQQLLEFNRNMTLKLLEEISQLDDPLSALIYQPGPQRAHIAWQIMHIAITEELFATNRLRKTTSHLSSWFPQFQKGSVADQNIPSMNEIRDILAKSRQNLLETLLTIHESDLDQIPEGLKERGWTNRLALQVICWHEAHHQGQAHLLLNSWKAGH